MRWFLAALTVTLWGLFGFAIVDHLNGNPTAVNGIIGAGVGAVLFSWITISGWRSYW
ncbi:hypothetical protein [Streptomyces sp. G1]|uniref:hypothetical protein n=1 Tax=Streptomyces sp. G1 TaxID=361572 RepID=UPI00202EA58A|nr:hypothetical protein [Streptomyces sp. G1]MCM1972308.1 hypothetical protein [Streptomyces sp. G1]